MSRFVDKKIKKINIIDWLNNNKFPEYNFDNLINKINLDQQDISIIFDKNIMEIISILLSRELFDNETIMNNNAPIYAAIQKNNYIYMYNKSSSQNQLTNQNSSKEQINRSNAYWTELTREKLISFMNKFQNKLIKVLAEWKQMNKTQMNNSDKLCEEYNRSLMKIMSTDFKNDIIYNKIRSLFYGKLKIDLKTIIEYEFEF
jgi:hypothetical protein